MGITGGLGRSVFHRVPEKNVKCRVEWRKWQFVRSYLCGEEYNSVIAEEDSGLVRSSEAIEPPSEGEKNHLPSEMSKEISSTANSEESKRYEQATRTIQSTFRNFQVCRRKEETESSYEKQDHDKTTEGSSRESLNTSIRVQAELSEVSSPREESTARLRRIHRRSKTQIFKLKEEWNDSTESSNITKMRIQNKLEATTRRERALAYAFSQQLRICSKRNHDKSNGMEADMGWTWLERWMATRLPENSMSESPAHKPLESIINSDKKPIIQRRIFDVV